MQRTQRRLWILQKKSWDKSADTKKTRSQNEEIRLNKFLSDAGVCSRREADRMIEAGKVKVYDHIAVMGEKVTADAKVYVDGKPIEPEEERILLAVNKPVGIECTCDKKNPDNIIDFLKYPKRLIYVGRLDKNSSGLLLMTNDGELANRITKSQEYHEKEYIVKVNRPITSAFVEQMRSGVEILNRVTRPCIVNQIDSKTFQIILTQGWNRQIRRMCEALGYKVLELKRIRIMNIGLNRLKEGSYRRITGEELQELLEQL